MLALINERAGQILDRQRILDAVVEDIRASFAALRCVVYERVNDTSQARVLSKAESGEIHLDVPAVFDLGDTWLKEAFAGSIISRPHISAGEPRDALLRRAHVGSAIMAPLAVAGKVNHAITLHFNQPGAYDDTDRLFFRSVASHLGLALANVQVYQLERQRRTRAESLERVVRMLRDTRTIEEVLLVFTVTVAHEGKIACAIYQMERGAAVRRAMRTLDGSRSGVAQNLDAKHLLPMLERGDLISAHELPDTIGRRLFGNHDGALVPLRINANVWGFVMYMEPPGGTVLRDTARKAYLRTLASHLELALAAAIGFERIQQLARALSESNEFKDDLLAMLAHDFKGPLTVIAGYCELLMESAPPHMREELETIFSQTKRLVALSEDAVALAQTQAGGFSLDRAVRDLREVVAESVKAHNRADDRIRFEMPSEPMPVSLDPARFNHVLDNVLMNALKYSEGPVDVRLTRADENISLAVADRGIGIPQAELAQVFTRFGRASNARRKGIAGSGVGLYVSRKIVEVHGGGIAVSSAEGRGSTFTITLPVAEAR